MVFIVSNLGRSENKGECATDLLVLEMGCPCSFGWKEQKFGHRLYGERARTEATPQPRNRATEEAGGSPLREGFQRGGDPAVAGPHPEKAGASPLREGF
jgi:hypothetical protein